jgi:FkbM family methyltransferase
MYSQGQEEEIIVRVLNAEKKVGHFLDCGAYDGRTFSNTLRLVELGWSGVCVEPSPSVFPALLKRHTDNPSIICVNAALAAKPGFMTFYDTDGDALSTSHQPHIDKWKPQGVPFRKMQVWGVTADQILDQFGSNFDFINLDVEGLSYELFTQLPLQKLAQTRVFCIEHDGKLGEIQELVSRYGFSYTWHNNENVIFSR